MRKSQILKKVPGCEFPGVFQVALDAINKPYCLSALFLTHKSKLTSVRKAIILQPQMNFLAKKSDKIEKMMGN